MKAITRIPALLGLAAMVIATARPPGATAQTTAIVNATIFQETGNISQGTVVMSDGRITAVGREVAIPAGATLVDARGGLVTPGFIHSNTGLGLVEVGSVAETREANKASPVTPAFNVLNGINPASVRIPIARAGGVTTALARPTGGLLAGQAVVIDLSGDRLEEMVVRTPAAMVLDLSSRSKEAGGGSRAGVVARVRQLFDDAREYRRRPDDFSRNQMQQLSAPADELAALWPVLDREIPVLVVAHRESDIENALRLATDYEFTVVILGGAEAWRIAGTLAARQVPVALNPFDNIPSFNGISPRFDNATLLAEAGVPLLLYETESGGPRNLRFAAGHAVRNGLPRLAALRAVTSGPAKAFGLEGYGTIAVGNVADVVIWDGDPFDFSGAPTHVYIRGVEMPRVTRQTELFDRYRTLPPSYFR